MKTIIYLIMGILLVGSVFALTQYGNASMGAKYAYYLGCIDGVKVENGLISCVEGEEPKNMTIIQNVGMVVIGLLILWRIFK